MYLSGLALVIIALVVWLLLSNAKAKGATETAQEVAHRLDRWAEVIAELTKLQLAEALRWRRQLTSNGIEPHTDATLVAHARAQIDRVRTFAPEAASLATDRNTVNEIACAVWGLDTLEAALQLVLAADVRASAPPRIDVRASEPPRIEPRSTLTDDIRARLDARRRTLGRALLYWVDLEDAVLDLHWMVNGTNLRPTGSPTWPLRNALEQVAARVRSHGPTEHQREVEEVLPRIVDSFAAADRIIHRGWIPSGDVPWQIRAETAAGPADGALLRMDEETLENDIDALSSAATHAHLLGDLLAGVDHEAGEASAR